MNARYTLIALGLLGSLASADLFAQTSSLGIRQRGARAESPELPASRETPQEERNRVYEQFAWISLPPRPPKTFRPGDLITIIVREQRKWEADSELETSKEYDVRSELEAFTKLTGGGIGASAFRRGKPNIDYKLRHELKSEGDSSREDRLVTRLTGKILDVKPNGLLVLEAKARIQHDEEASVITMTGTCRKQDVTADNTILSTQIADKDVVVKNEGALGAAARRGWIPKLVDWLRPF